MQEIKIGLHIKFVESLSLFGVHVIFIKIHLKSYLYIHPAHKGKSFVNWCGTLTSITM